MNQNYSKSQTWNHFWLYISFLELFWFFGETCEDSPERVTLKPLFLESASCFFAHSAIYIIWPQNNCNTIILFPLSFIVEDFISEKLGFLILIVKVKVKKRSTFMMKYNTLFDYLSKFNTAKIIPPRIL